MGDCSRTDRGLLFLELDLASLALGKTSLCLSNDPMKNTAFECRRTGFTTLGSGLAPFKDILEPKELLGLNPLPSFQLPKPNFFSEAIMRRAVSIGRDNLMSLGTCFGKFTKTGKFTLSVTCLDYLARYAKVRFSTPPRPPILLLVIISI